ncbi:MAG: hypothetical protein ACOYZ8_05465 [Chloroflexota bacterium]
MGKKTTYLRAVINKAVRETQRQFGGNVRKFMLAVALIITVAISRYFILGRSSAMNFLAELVVDSILVGGMFLFVLFLLNLLRAPRLIYYEQQNGTKVLEERIDELDKIIKRELVKASVNFEVYPRSSEGYASIKIFNNESRDLTGCYVKLEEVFVTAYVPNDIVYDGLEAINPNNYFISWAGGGGGNGYTTIERKNYSVLNVAKVVRSENWWFAFLFHKGEEKRLHRQGDYKIKISFRGLLDGKPIEPVEYRFVMSLSVKRVDENTNEIQFSMMELENERKPAKRRKKRIS